MLCIRVVWSMDTLEKKVVEMRELYQMELYQMELYQMELYQMEKEGVVFDDTNTLLGKFFVHLVCSVFTVVCC